MDTRVSNAPRRRPVRWLVTVALTLTLAATGLVQGTDRAEALTASDFKAGTIISDSEFYDSSAMTEKQIRDFLNARIGNCLTDQCLNVRTDRVASRARIVSDSTGNVRCEAFQGGTALSAATVIFRVQRACGISAKVILVTLQKEQALVTKNNPSKAALDRAMGYACPDTAPCAINSLGFGNQIYQGTLQLKTYKASRFGIQPGSRAIQWHPNAACGSRTVNITNYATAALYNYTPYRPNQAALNNLRGTGDACSSYGNRNFWVFYNDWFGSPIVDTPAPLPPNITPAATATRTAGVNRFDTAVQISRANYAPRTSTVYVANGLNFPDALSAAPAAATNNSPLLLTRRDGIDPATRAEIQRLRPLLIVISGGVDAVSEAVAADLATIAPVRRDSGGNRYSTSLEVARGAFAAKGATVAYLATGRGYADALSAGAAAGSVDAPVILVDGSASTLTDEAITLLGDLGVEEVRIAGGVAVVSTDILRNTKGINGGTAVTRIAGVNRFETGEKLNAAAFANARMGTIYAASGTAYSDALAGAALAGKNNNPLYLVPKNCMRIPLAQKMIAARTTSMVILGGTSVVTGEVAKYTNCR
ncbi:cell wall-binding repeat-containing protein [Marisediminicola sp. LYQ134]|uniref:cell wall-binding repeat-containing protein n=1 Tax=Marisediminicola sp. LYQ134 TaxID=3391061 RepID=UPI003983548B